MGQVKHHQLYALLDEQAEVIKPPDKPHTQHRVRGQEEFYQSITSYLPLVCVRQHTGAVEHRQAGFGDGTFARTSDGIHKAVMKNEAKE